VHRRVIVSSSDRMTILPPRQQVLAFRAVTLALVAGAGATFLPFWAPLVVAAWVATMARPLVARIAKVTGGRHRGAGALVVSLVVVLFVPFAVGAASLWRGAVDLGQSVLRSGGAKSALIAIASGGAPAPDAKELDLLKSPGKIVDLVQAHGTQAARIVGGIAGAATEVIVGLFIFFYAVYVFLVDGPAQYRWLEEHAPFDAAHTRRLAAAYHETGRGLFVGVGLTGLTQGCVATAAYLALGVPRALVLGLLTCVASLIPSVGTALVWAPTAIGLALAGKGGAAAILAGIGVFVISTIDNVMRPVFARLGKLELSTFTLLTAIFGGLAAFGAGGLILGPLIVRLAKESLMIARLDRSRDGGPALVAPGDAAGPSGAPQ